MNDSTIKIDALWALTYIADCNEEYIQTVVDSGVITTIVPLLSSHCYKSMLAAIRLLGNIATGTDAQTDVLLSNDILIHIRFPLMHHKENLRRMALWCLSNITVGTQDQVQAVFHSGLLNRIIEGLARPDLKTCKEALYTISNMITSGSLDDAMDIINAGAVDPLVQLMMTNDIPIVTAAIHALKSLFSKCQLLVGKYADLYERIVKSS